MIMTRERLLTLGQCYGADPRRWPAAERAAAEALLAADAGASAALADQARLDALLDSYPAQVAGAPLRQRILAGAARRRSGWSRWLSPQVWVAATGLGAGWGAGMGAGLAAAGIAGVMFGSTLVSAAPAPEDAWTSFSAPVEATAFGLAGTEVG